jgi:hypothetical protein
VIQLVGDEDFPRPVIVRLRSIGYDAITCPEIGLANLRTPDSAILAWAIENGRAVLTHNRSHFLRLHRAAPNHHGILICTRDLDHRRLTERVVAALGSGQELTGVLVRVTRSGFRRSDVDLAAG